MLGMPRYSVLVPDPSAPRGLGEDSSPWDRASAIERASTLREQGIDARAFDWGGGGPQGLMLDPQTEGES